MLRALQMTCTSLRKTGDDWLPRDAEAKYKNSLGFQISVTWLDSPSVITSWKDCSCSQSINIQLPQVPVRICGLQMTPSANILNRDAIARVRRVSQNFAVLLDIIDCSSGRANLGAVIDCCSVGEGHGAKVGKRGHSAILQEILNDPLRILLT